MVAIKLELSKLEKVIVSKILMRIDVNHSRELVGSLFASFNMAMASSKPNWAVCAQNQMSSRNDTDGRIRIDDGERMVVTTNDRKEQSTIQKQSQVLVIIRHKAMQVSLP